MTDMVLRLLEAVKHNVIWTDNSVLVVHIGFSVQFRLPAGVWVLLGLIRRSAFWISVTNWWFHSYTARSHTHSTLQ